MKKPTIVKLHNGLQIALLRLPWTESVTLQLRGLAGSNYEQSEFAGVAHLLEHWVLKGSKNYPNEQKLLGLITANGGKYIGVTSRDDVLFGTHVLKDDLENALIFLAEIFKNPLLPVEHLADLKEVSKKESARYYDIPEKLISRLAYATLFPNSRQENFNTGSTKTIDSITADRGKDFYAKHYASNRFILTLCGNFDQKYAVSLINNYFGDEITGEKLFESEPAITPKRNVAVYNKFNFLQDYIRIDFEGAAIRDNDKYSLLILAKYAETLIKQTIKNKGIAYKTGCDSFNARNYGIFSIFGETKKGDLGLFTHEIAQITKSVQKNLNERLLESCKKSIIANILFSLEKPSMAATYYSELLLHGNKNQNHLYEIERISKEDLRDIRESAARLFGKNPKITIISNQPNILTDVNM